MKNIYRKHFTTMALVWAGCFILFLFAYMIILAPQGTSKKKIESQLAEKKDKYDSILEASRDETKHKLNEQIERLREKLKTFVVDFEDSANLTFDISQIASEKKVGAFTIQGRDKSSKSSELKHLIENYIDVSFGGDFNQFATFLNALERHEPIVFVNNFKITRAKGNESAHQVNMNLAVLVKKKQDS